MIWFLSLITISVSASTFRISRMVHSDRAEVIFHTSEKGIVRERNSNAFGKQEDHGYGRSYLQANSQIKKISSELSSLAVTLKKSDSLLKSFGERGISSLMDEGSQYLRIEIDDLPFVPGSKDYQKALVLANELLNQDWKISEGKIIEPSPLSITNVKAGRSSSPETLDPFHYCGRTGSGTLCKFPGTGPVYIE